MKAYTETTFGVTLHLRVTPNAHDDRIDGFEIRADGKTVLRLRVKAPPDKGKANKSVIALMARRLKIPKSAISLVNGETSRIKTLEIRSDTRLLVGALQQFHTK